MAGFTIPHYISCGSNSQAVHYAMCNVFAERFMFWTACVLHIVFRSILAEIDGSRGLLRFGLDQHQSQIQSALTAISVANKAKPFFLFCRIHSRKLFLLDFWFKDLVNEHVCVSFGLSSSATDITLIAAQTSRKHSTGQIGRRISFKFNRHPFAVGGN